MIVTLVMGKLAGKEIELTTVGFTDGVTMDNVLSIAVDMHTVIDTNQLIGLACQGNEIVRHRHNSQG